jgi:DoxX-like family
VSGAVALLVPGFPRLKEWAYAGAVFTYTGAVGSHLAVSDGAGALVIPIISPASRPPPGPCVRRPAAISRQRGRKAR